MKGLTKSFICWIVLINGLMKLLQLNSLKDLGTNLSVCGIKSSKMLVRKCNYKVKSMSTYKYFWQESTNLLTETLPEQLHYAIPEIEVYLVESVGNSTRIDYGSGHEMSFVIFLYCIFKINFFSMECQSEVGLMVFERYFLIFSTTFTQRLSTAFGYVTDIYIWFVNFSWHIEWSLLALMECGAWMTINLYHLYGEAHNW